MHQRKKIALEIAAKIANVNGLLNKLANENKTL
jgi:flagellar hook-associated protein FlgK